MSSENTNYITYLIEHAQNGRKNSFIDLCEINLKNVFTATYRLTKDLKRSTLITLRAFLTAWENIQTLNTRHSFALWIKGLAIKIAIREIFSREDEPAKPNEQTLYAHEFQKIETIIMNLPKMERIIYVLHDFEDYNYDEIRGFLEELTIDEIKTILIGTRELIMKQIGI